jgi:chitin disaccharide deacetylase
MSRFVIINGDDFGFSKGVNQAIVEAHQRGILTSTSLMVTGNAFEEAVLLAKAHPKLAVGLHLVLGCGKSVLTPSQIPHLVDNLGNFSNHAIETGLRYQFDRSAKRELSLEIRAQLEKFRQTGLFLSHVDGHLHHHSHPVVLRILVELAEEFAIKVIRLPYEELSFTLKIERNNLLGKAIGSWVFSCLRHYGEGLLDSKGISFAERVYGLLQTGRITEDYLLRLIPQIQANLVEIYAHPAIDSSGAGKLELDALLSQKVRDILNLSGFELTNYQVLGAIESQ